MAGGPFRWFDAALDKIAKNQIRLDTDPIYAILVGAATVLDETFVGSSGDCRYADVTAVELATANGYTAGGVLLPSPAFSRAANVVKFTSLPINWLLSNSITYKYAIIRCDNANDDLICFMDGNTAGTGSTSSPTAGALTITPHASGIVGWQRV